VGYKDVAPLVLRLSFPSNSISTQFSSGSIIAGTSIDLTYKVELENLLEENYE
jgi:hypothetical protein